MISKKLVFGTILALASAFTSSSAVADAKPDQSMTHLKTAPGITSVLEGERVILFAQGGATAGVMGGSISSSKGQAVFHIPVTSRRTGFEHQGSIISFFNLNNDRQLDLKNPVIDLEKGQVLASLTDDAKALTPIFTITNVDEIESKRSVDRTMKLRIRQLVGVKMNLAPGVAGTIASSLNLPAGILTEGLEFASADVSIKRKLK